MTTKKPRVAYFCMEYGLHESFKIYGGGLGILAGDILKTARQYRYPLVGLGILWRQGYTKQLIGQDGFPYDAYPNYSYDFLQDTDVVVPVDIRGRTVQCKVWKVKSFQNAPLYLLDTSLSDHDRWITGQLYGWFSEERVAQELVLGVGGIKALRALGIEPDIYHFNEGHAVFAGLELIREKMGKDHSFAKAWEATREQVVFSTHTPVPEGNEKHPLDLLHYMGADSGFSRDQMMKIGGSPFNMTIAGLRLSRIANGVSELHCKTAQSMWEHAENTAPIIPITNGVHRKTWVDPRLLKAQDLWETHQVLKEELLQFIKEKKGVQLHPQRLLIGFARRAAPYKRGDFIFQQADIIEPLLEKQDIQLIFSGKAHPLDDEGKKIVARFVEMEKRFPQSVVFLEDYDMEIGRYLTRGCDVWLNNPRRPLEASGTSGMKAAMNGVLNFSTLDGWWPEGCEHGVNGWAIGQGHEGEDQDELDLQSLYTVLNEEIIPTYYENREAWTSMMKSSMDMSYEKFSARHMLDRYYKEMYGEKKTDG